jgi:hypothetical protein
MPKTSYSKINKTLLLIFNIAEVSAHLLAGMSNDDEKDKTLSI